MAGEGDLKLLGMAVSPFVLRVRMALHMKGVSYEYIEQDILDKGELLLRYNPVHKKVPVLIHNGVPLCESQVIVQYIDEVWAGANGSSILPADPYERATARFWAAYVDDKIRARGKQTENRTMACEGGLKLLGLTVSPFVARVRITLQLKGIGYEYIEQDLFIKGELLLTSNPVHKKVPVLIHGGKPVCEWLAIVQYVDEAWAATGPSILPADPYERADARFWAAYADSKLLPAWVGIMWAATEEERAEKVEDALTAIGHLEVAFGKCSNGKAFFAGDSVGYLDLVLGSQLLWFEALQKMFGVVVIEAGKAPLLAAWVKRFGETDTAKEVVPDVGTAVEYLKTGPSR